MNSQGFWGAFVIALWVAALSIFQRYRRRSQGFAERAAFRAALPAWVSLFEMSIFISVFFGIIVTLMMLQSGLYRHLNSAGGAHNPSGFSSLLIVMAIGTVSVLFAMLFANFISWIIPPVRRANQRAAQRLSTMSFAQANSGPLKFGAVIVPVCILQGLIGLIEPWGR